MSGEDHAEAGHDLGATSNRPLIHSQAEGDRLDLDREAARLETPAAGSVILVYDAERVTKYSRRPASREATEGQRQLGNAREPGIGGSW